MYFILNMVNFTIFFPILEIPTTDFRFIARVRRFFLSSPHVNQLNLGTYRFKIFEIFTTDITGYY